MRVTGLQTESYTAKGTREGCSVENMLQNSLQLKLMRLLQMYGVLQAERSLRPDFVVSPSVDIHGSMPRRTGDSEVLND